MTQLLTVAEVANELNVSEKTVRRWVRTGIVPAARLPSGGIRFSQRAIEAIAFDIETVTSDGTAAASDSGRDA